MTGSPPLIRLITCVGVELQHALLTHFLDHYRQLGVTSSRTHVILNTLDLASARLRECVSVLETYGIEPAEVWIGPYTSDGMWQKRRELQVRVADPGDWIISADVDELHEYPEALEPFLDRCAGAGVTAVQGVMLDRLSADGSLAPVRPEPPLEEQFPLVADVMCTVGRTGEHHDWYGTVKLMAFRAAHLPSRGGHHPTESAGVRYLYGRHLARFRWIGHASFRFFSPLKVHHYKWTRSLVPSLDQRLAKPGVSAAGAEYGGKIRSYVTATRGVDIAGVPVRRDSIADRIPWQVRTWLLRRLGQSESLLGRVVRRIRR